MAGEREGNWILKVEKKSIITSRKIPIHIGRFALEAVGSVDGGGSLFVRYKRKVFLSGGEASLGSFVWKGGRKINVEEENRSIPAGGLKIANGDRRLG
jgi:hypothetical protein